jgi:hypothetical protein
MGERDHRCRPRPVPGGVPLDGGDGVVEDLVMAGDGRGYLLAVGFPTPGRTLDIGEEER